MATRDAAVGATMIAMSLLFAGYIAYERLPDILRTEQIDSAVPVYALPLDGAHTQGDRSAPVAVIVYSDFVCPACARLALRTLPQIVERYVRTKKVLLVHRHFPGGKFRPLAFRAAEGAACAGEQQQFWPMHDAIFNARAEGREYGRSDVGQLETDLRQFASTLGLDLSGFERCLAGGQTQAVFEDAGSGVALGVNGTPAILIGRIQTDGRVRVLRHLNGRPPDDQLFAAIDGVLQAPAYENRNSSTP